jgi:hypothetical protein
MYIERLEDLSVYYWLKNIFADAPFVNIVDAFPTSDLVIPTISIEWQQATGVPLELGSRQLLRERIFYFDIFAKNKSQRDEFAYRLFNELDNDITVYNYNEGFPEQGVTPSRLGSLILVEKTMQNIQVDPDLVDELYYRAAIYFTAKYDQF